MKNKTILYFCAIYDICAMGSKYTFEDHLNRIMKGRMIGPYFVDLGVTPSCNLACHMCARVVFPKALEILTKSALHGFFKAFGIDTRFYGPVRDIIEHKFGIQRKHKILINSAQYREVCRILTTHNLMKDKMFAIRKYIYDGIQNKGYNALDIAIVYIAVIKYIIDWYSESLGYERIFEIVNETLRMGAREYNLAGLGEPFMNKGLTMDLIDIIKSNNASCGIITNGTLLDQNLAETIVKKNVDYISVSIDAPIPKVNDQMRGLKGALKMAVRGIKHINNAKRKHGYGPQDNPIIRINTVLTKNNVPLLKDLVVLASNLDVTDVYFLPLMIHTPSVDILDPMKLDDPYIYLYEALDVAMAEGIGTNADVFLGRRLKLSKIMYYTDDKSVYNFFLSLFGTEMTCDYVYPTQKDISKIRCIEPWINAVIDVNGKLNPCCYTYKEFMNVDLRHMGFRDAWYSSEMNLLRHRILTSNGDVCNGVCHPLALLRTERIKQQIATTRINNGWLKRLFSR